MRWKRLAAAALIATVLTGGPVLAQGGGQFGFGGVGGTGGQLGAGGGGGGIGGQFGASGGGAGTGIPSGSQGSAAVPEIDTNHILAALVLLTMGALMLTARLTRK